MQGIPYETFRWDDAFASGWQWPAGGVAIYLVVVLLLSIGMKNAKPFELGSTAVVHNLLLSLGSLVMLLGTLLELHRRWSASESFDWFFCEAPATQTSGPLFFWSYVYYLSKYYEMFDTVLVLLQKSRVPHFKLQVYHHAAVVPWRARYTTPQLCRSPINLSCFRNYRGYIVFYKLNHMSNLSPKPIPGDIVNSNARGASISLRPYNPKH